MPSLESLKHCMKKDDISRRSGLLTLVVQMAALNLPISSTKRMKQQSIAAPKRFPTPSTSAQ